MMISHSFSGLSICYDTGEPVEIGGCSGTESQHELTLEKNERITGVGVGCGWLIDRLTFYTNRGRTFGPWGGDGGNTHPVEKPKDEQLGSLIGFEGWNVHDQEELTITDLKFIWQERAEFHKDSEGEESDSEYSCDSDDARFNL